MTISSETRGIAATVHPQLRANKGALEGRRPDSQAFARLRAAEALAHAARRAEADVQLRARAFYRSVGASAYVQEAERLLAASA